MCKPTITDCDSCPQPIHDRKSASLISGHNKICDNILTAVGETPLVRLNKIPQLYGLKCQVLAKCEFLNPGGSIKDRTVTRMIEDAERSGLIKPGDTLIEATSGNTGIGLALVCLVKGYKCIIVMPESCSMEKEVLIRSLGGQVVRTIDVSSSFIEAERLNHVTPNSYLLNQFDNPSNRLVHYEVSAEEILEQCDGNIDMLVAGAGTGGTISGIGMKLLEVNPNCRIVCSQPEGSTQAPDDINLSSKKWLVEGIGGNFVAKNLNQKIVTDWITVSDQQSFSMARMLIQLEGLLVGASSGSIVAAAVEAAKSLSPDQTVVVILPDGVRNYMSKFLDDQWMADHKFDV